MFSASQLSKQIRARKKSMQKAPVDLIGTSPKPDMDGQDIWDKEKEGQIQDTVDSPDKISAMDAPEYEQEPMSHEPMESKFNPKNHSEMAYGGKPMDDGSEAMFPAYEDQTEVGGSPSTKAEMAMRIAPDAFPSGDDIEAEEARRIGMRKQRLSDYLEGLVDF